MKQIIPFQKELLLKTKVSEVTSISLDHNLTLNEDNLIKGSFHISGTYKMTEGSINREQFDFDIPFEISLNDRYKASSLVIDIDNFYYELINNESLKVNIDVAIEGEKEEIMEEATENIVEDNKEEPKDIREDKEMEIDDMEESIDFQKPEQIIIEEKEPSKKDFNIFENIDNSDTYVTYHVYILKEDDTIDKIIDHYKVTKEDISLYNNIEEIKPGTKLIIPNNNE